MRIRRRTKGMRTKGRKKRLRTEKERRRGYFYLIVKAGHNPFCPWLVPTC
jgi:hypothetical protein